MHQREIRGEITGSSGARKENNSALTGKNRKSITCRGDPVSETRK
jgi:hypothetical protein